MSESKPFDDASLVLFKALSKLESHRYSGISQDDTCLRT